MPSTYTPGPWRLGESKGGQWFVYGADSEQPFKPHVKIPKRYTKLQFANARLISAAPELLDALRSLVDAIHEPDKMSGVLLVRAEAAIAKAEDC